MLCCPSCLCFLVFYTFSMEPESKSCTLYQNIPAPFTGRLLEESVRELREEAVAFFSLDFFSTTCVMYVYVMDVT